MYIRSNSNKIKNLRMEKKRGKHWTIKFESDIKWIKPSGTTFSNCHCGNHEEVVLEFHRGKKLFRRQNLIDITICAENTKEDKELLYNDFIIDTDKYDTIIHILVPGVDY